MTGVGMLIALIVVVLIAYSIYRYEKVKGLYQAGVSTSSTAFGKVADAEGKLIALRAMAEAKKQEALEAHAALDEVHSILG